MKKVLFIAPNSIEYGGSFRSMMSICSRLNDNGYKTYVVVNDNKKLNNTTIDNTLFFYVRSNNWIIKIGEHISRKTIIKKKLRNIYAAYQIKKIIKKEDISLVHINSAWTYVGAFAAKLAGIPCVWHIREMLEEDQNRTIWSQKGCRFFSLADRVIAISKCVRNKYKAFIPDNKLVLVYNGIDTGQFLFTGEKKNDKYVFLSVGNMDGGKGQDIIIKAAKILKEYESSLNFQVLLVGDGREKEYYEQLTEKLKIKDTVIFLGNRKDVCSLYAKADFFVMSSACEAFGRVTVEAMLGQCTIIGANSGATPECINDGKYGYLFEAGNENSLAEQMLSAMKNIKKSREVAFQAQQYALTQFTLDKNIEGITEIYNQLI